MARCADSTLFSGVGTEFFSLKFEADEMAAACEYTHIYIYIHMHILFYVLLSLFILSLLFCIVLHWYCIIFQCIVLYFMAG